MVVLAFLTLAVVGLVGAIAAKASADIIDTYNLLLEVYRSVRSPFYCPKCGHCVRATEADVNDEDDEDEDAAEGGGQC